MTKSISNRLTLILALLGCGLALLLTVEHYTQVDLPGCTKTGAGCAATLNSAYGHLGPIPTAAFGLAMYLVIAGLCVLRGKQLRTERNLEESRAAAYAVSGADTDLSPRTGDASTTHTHTIPDSQIPSDLGAGGLSVRKLDAILWGIAVLGFGTSIWLQYVAIYQLENFCKYCFGSAVLVTLIFALTSRDHLLDGRKLNGEQKMLGGVLAFIALLGSFIVVPQILEIINRPVPKVDPPHTVVAIDQRTAVLNQLLHVKGDPKATYTLIEFADYMCGHCAKAAPIMEEFLRQHPKDLRIAFRNFPLPIPSHKWARSAAMAAEAAGKQGKFWEMHDLLFQHQTDMESPDFREKQFNDFAGELKLDVTKFALDGQSEELRTLVMKDYQAGETCHVQSTPTFFFVTPTQVIQFAGTEKIEKFMSDPKRWSKPFVEADYK